MTFSRRESVYLALFLSAWGFVMATGLCERCGFSWTVSFEAGAEMAAFCFLVGIIGGAFSRWLP